MYAYRKDEKELRRKLHAENEVRKIVNIERAKIAEAMKPFIGKKVINADGSLCKKAKDLLEFDYDVDITPFEPGDHAKLHVCYLQSASSYAMWLKVSVCFSGGNRETWEKDKKGEVRYCQYHDATYTALELENQTLKDTRSDKLDLLLVEGQIQEYNKAFDALEAFNAVNDKLYSGIRIS